MRRNSPDRSEVYLITNTRKRKQKLSADVLRTNFDDEMEENLVYTEKSEEPRLMNVNRFHVVQLCHLPTFTRVEPINNPPVFIFDQEKELAEKLIKMISWGFVFSEHDVATFAYDFAETNNIPHNFCRIRKAAGNEWIASFKKSNPDVSMIESSHNDVLHCEKRTSKEEIHKYFNLLSDTMDQYHFLKTPQLVYNVDETVYISTDATKDCNLKFPKTYLEDNATMIVCVSVSGQRIPPLAIHSAGRKSKNKRNDLLPLWKYGDDGEEIFIRWLRHFKKYRNSGSCLLLLDGNPRHKTYRVLDFCESNDIQMICIPAERLHPLDVILPEVKSNYNSKCMFLGDDPACQRIVRRTFGTLFSIALAEIATRSVIQYGFAEVGIVPLNVDAMLKNMHLEYNSFEPNSTIASGEQIDPLQKQSVEEINTSNSNLIKEEVILSDSNDSDESLTDTAPETNEKGTIPEDIVPDITKPLEKPPETNVNPQDFCLTVTDVEEDIAEMCAFCNVKASDPVSVLIGELIQCQGEGGEWYHRRCVGAEPYEYFTCGRCIVHRIRTQRVFKLH